MKTLVAEDDPAVAEIVAAALRASGHVVDLVTTGDDALWLAREVPFDLLVLDLQLPGLNGLEVCRQLRAEGSAVPILILTGLGAVSDRVAGLDAGADDYLPKPFAVDELRARVRALTRRPQAPLRDVLEVGDVRLDLVGRTVTKRGEEIDLTAKEVSVLEVLLRNAGGVVTRDQLLAAAWDFAFDPASNVVDVYIALLRRKLDDPYETHTIRTVRGVGYRLELPEDPASS